MPRGESPTLTESSTHRVEFESSEFESDSRSLRRLNSNSAALSRVIQISRRSPTSQFLVHSLKRRSSRSLPSTESPTSLSDLLARDWHFFPTKHNFSMSAMDTSESPLITSSSSSHSSLEGFSLSGDSLAAAISQVLTDPKRKETTIRGIHLMISNLRKKPSNALYRKHRMDNSLYSSSCLSHSCGCQLSSKNSSRSTEP